MKTLFVEPGRRVALTADSHIGHANILQYCNRPWLSDAEREAVERGERIKVSPESVRAHDEEIVRRCNEVLGPDDLLIHVGDVAWGSGERLAYYFDGLRVTSVVVVLGNHDDAAKVASHVGPENVCDTLMLHVGRQASDEPPHHGVRPPNDIVVCQHHPLDVWDGAHHGSFHAYGHVHGKGEVYRRSRPAWGLSQDVGVDLHEFYPWLWHEELRPLLESRRPAWRAWQDATLGGIVGGMAPEVVYRRGGRVTGVVNGEGVS